MVNKGLLILLSGPSGVGKGTLCTYLRSELENLAYSVSATTRKARHGEVDGVNYYFLSHEEFLTRRDNEDFLEWAEVYGNYYGTPKATVEQNLTQGKDVILEIDIQGALRVKELYPEAVCIFIMPPSKSELEKRIKGRGTDSEEVIAKRLCCVEKELNSAIKYDYLVVNDVIEKAGIKVRAIITSEKCRVDRVLKHGFMFK